MSTINLVVVHCLNGEVLKGTTHDFNVAQDRFHISPAMGGSAIQVHCADLKAVFFVKEFEGNPGHHDRKDFVAPKGAPPQGKKMAVLFKDGELLLGYSVGYVKGRQGFFMTPADPSGNNIRIYVIEGSARRIEIGPGADKLIQENLASAWR